MITIRPLLLASLTVAAITLPALALTPAQKTLLDSYQTAAKGDAARGKMFFFANHGTGKPDTPACTACHTTNLSAPGKTRTGKTIEPMAASVSPQRFTDPANVEKWFKRNCADVVGRACTAQEKSDILAFLSSL